MYIQEQRNVASCLVMERVPETGFCRVEMYLRHVEQVFFRVRSTLKNHQIYQKFGQKMRKILVQPNFSGDSGVTRTITSRALLYTLQCSCCTFPSFESEILLNIIFSDRIRKNDASLGNYFLGSQTQYKNS